MPPKLETLLTQAQAITTLVPFIAREPDLAGKHITVVYRIEDPIAWRKANPLHYQHDGLKSVGVSIGDLMERRDKLREALEGIAEGFSFDAKLKAQSALDSDDATG